MIHKNTRRIKKNMNGETVYIEVCEEGDLCTVNPKCYDKLSGSGKKYSVKELLLLLLGVDSDVPLKQTLLMKEAFLFEKELSRKLNLHIEPLNYVPYKYGPYSSKVDENISNMGDLLEISKVSNKKEISLTSKGKKVAKELIDSLPDETVQKLKFNRIGWDQYGNKGILKRVYTDYPVYTVKSEIKDDVLRNK